MLFTAISFLLILLSSQLSVVQAQRFSCPEIDNDPCEPLATVHQISEGVCVEECRRLGLFAQVLSQWTCGVCPTASPTNSPTDSPTPNPTNSPTPNPTNSPTSNPTNSPTPNPTNSPTSLDIQCSGPYNVLDETERGVDFNDGNGGYECCDRISSSDVCPAWQGNGWYRFMGEGGTRMPDMNDLVPEVYDCGTDAPGWMNGTHPLVVDGIVSRQVCFNWDGITCSWSVNINVVNCNDFFLYKLVEQSACHLSFCATNAPLGGV